MKIKGLAAMVRNRLNRANVYSQAEFWDAKAEQLKGSAVSMWPNVNLNTHYQREQFELIESLLPTPQGMRILDIGCGFGRLSRYLADRGAHVVGLDFSEKSIEIAKKASDKDNPVYRVQSVFNLDDPPQYDVAFTWGTLAIASRTREELAVSLERIHQGLKPGGTLLLLEPIHRGFLHRVLNMSVREFIGVMKEVGFTIHQTHQLHFWPMRLALAYINIPSPITNFGYRLGQTIMKSIFRNKFGGDYTCIYAKKEA
jgi:2-polyprenyl-3-methyl-5-hydroxy-6-metoxy-1,4-benzoquinol methylase